jgi:hypothetical protein
VRKDVLQAGAARTAHAQRHPAKLVSADMLRTTSRKRGTGMHVRFLVRHWEPRLLQHGAALEQEFCQRLLALDPLAPNWLMGFSWQFALEDRAPARRCRTRLVDARRAPPQDQRAPRPSRRTSSKGRWSSAHRGRGRADLEQLLALRDDDQKRQPRGDHFAATRPATL